MLNSGCQQARKVFSAAMCKCGQRSILSIPKMSDKYNTQVEGSIKARSIASVLLYLNELGLWLLPEVVAPSHLETICSQKGIGQEEAMFYRLV